MVFPNPDKLLLPGAYVRAVIQEGLNEQAILIPQQCVSRDPRGNPMALTVNKEGKVEQKPLVLDRAIGDRWLVASGLNVGEQVIVEGSMKVRPGSPAKAVPFVKPEQGKSSPEATPSAAKQK
jgi:membrane fusion protein (multidrug efflux system)